MLKIFSFVFFLINCSHTNTIVIDNCTLIRKHLDSFTLGFFKASSPFSCIILLLLLLYMVLGKIDFECLSDCSNKNLTNGNK